jgi:hypothetical protein
MTQEARHNVPLSYCFHWDFDVYNRYRLHPHGDTPQDDEMHTASHNPKLIYSIRGAMEVTDFSRSFIFDSIKNGDLDRVKIGKRTFVTKASLETLVENLIENGRIIEHSQVA